MNFKAYVDQNAAASDHLPLAQQFRQRCNRLGSIDPL
jgi:hypothetical protein